VSAEGLSARRLLKIEAESRFKPLPVGIDQRDERDRHATDERCEPGSIRRSAPPVWYRESSTSAMCAIGPLRSEAPGSSSPVPKQSADANQDRSPDRNARSTQGLALEF
jgi:hypothetical protein